MTLNNENVDFSGLFKLDVLLQFDVKSYSFYELGLKKFLAFSSDRELIFIFINTQLDRQEKNYDWDFLDNPIYCMCFEPSGTWVSIVSEEKLLLIPYLPLFIPQNTFDCKWSLSCVTVLPLGIIPQPTSMVWWLTKESENILIIGSKASILDRDISVDHYLSTLRKGCHYIDNIDTSPSNCTQNGSISFYSLESQTIVGETKVPGDIVNLQICFDDSLDLLALLISSSKNQHWKLVLEHRSFDYNWLQQTKIQSDKDKKDFMSYIKQLSKDKITFFIQGTSKGDKAQTVEYVLKPTEYLPLFRKGSNNWALTAQYVNGRHFLSAFETNEGTLILESPEEATPSRTLRPQIKKEGSYMQGLWSQKLVYLLREDHIEVHSAQFSVIQSEGTLGAKNESILWSAELIGKARRAHVMAAKEPTAPSSGWKEPTFLCDLQLPRFNIEPCLVITDKGAFIVNTVTEPCEWVVGGIARATGAGGAELAAAALGAPLGALLRGAADLLLARGRQAPALLLYSLAQTAPEGWLARLGVFGKIEELSTFKPSANFDAITAHAAIALKLLATMLRTATDGAVFDTDMKFTALGSEQLLEACKFAAAAGLWELVPTFSVHRGRPALLLSALAGRPPCRGALRCLLGDPALVTLLLEEDAQWLLDYIEDNCDQFDTTLAKCLFLWLNPLQEQLRPVLRDLNQGISSVYTARMMNLIATSMRVACTIESRERCPEICKEVSAEPDTWKTQFVSRRGVSCGLAHYAVTDGGQARVLLARAAADPRLVGRVLAAACGRHHTLLLTENGIYACGDNRYGQLGAGRAWDGAGGDAARGGGALRRVPRAWRAPLVAVAAGHYHSAALDAGGRLYTWGWNVHGQLGLDSIEDQCSPQLVARFQGRKVLKVSCGACHTVLLTRNGEVWACGAGVFGQLGAGKRDKSSVFLRVALPDPVRDIAVGYFHNLALTSKNTLYTWGASPQQVRASFARASPAATPTSPAFPASPALPPAPPAPPAVDPHLLPAAVDCSNVRGQIVQISAGWHHSCLLNNRGDIYSWGLNFDGQLGSGDRKQIPIPTEVRIQRDTQPDQLKPSSAEPMDLDAENHSTAALVACGGDFTVYVDDDGRIYATGNMHLQSHSELEKLNNKVIMMKTTKRVIKIPTSRNNKKFLFQPVDRIDIMFPFDIEDSQRKPIDTRPNPMRCLKDFDKKSWADDIILSLSPWVDEKMVSSNMNMAAKLAFQNKMYAKCLKLSLDNLKTVTESEKMYLIHTEDEDTDESVVSQRKIQRNASIKNVMLKRIKEISLSILNEEPYPEVNDELFKSIPCSCDEMKYLPQIPKSKQNPDVNPDVDLSINAANVIDNCINIFPVSSDLWETCFSLSKNFYLENNLSVAELEKVLSKYMQLNAPTMADAILYSRDCAQYSQILSPKFYLKMSSAVLDTWG